MHKLATITIVVMAAGCLDEGLYASSAKACEPGYLLTQGFELRSPPVEGRSFDGYCIETVFPDGSVRSTQIKEGVARVNTEMEGTYMFHVGIRHETDAGCGYERHGQAAYQPGITVVNLEGGIGCN